MIWLKKHRCCVLFVLILPYLYSSEVPAQEAPVPFVSASLPLLNKSSAAMNQQLLPLLRLLQESSRFTAVATTKTAKIIQDETPVREANQAVARVLLLARMGEEFPVLELQDNWFKIKTRDNREGWVFETDIQLLSKQVVELRNDLDPRSRQEAMLILSQMNRYYKRIEELYNEAVVVISSVEEGYKSLTREKKLEMDAEYTQFMAVKSKIEKYHTYAIRYYEPYSNIQTETGVSLSTGITPGERFKGSVAADVGQSTYQNMGSHSETSSRLSFSGEYQINKSTKANIVVNNQNELVQTAFNNTQAEAGISSQLGNLILGSQISYQAYKDKATDENTFGQIRTGMNILYNPGKKASLFGNIGFQGKNFSNADQDYKDIFFSFGTNLMTDANHSVKILIQGNTQFSQVDYLDFTQIKPRISYTSKKSSLKSFTLNLGYENLSYGMTENYSGYQKYQTDFTWKNHRSKKALNKSLILTYKTYPYNAKQDYARIAYTLTRRKGSLQQEASTVSTFSPVLTIITQPRNNILTDYVDLRWDRTAIRSKGFLTTNIYSRLRNNFEMMINDTGTMQDHVVDFYSEFGPYLRNLSHGTIQFTSLKIGIVFGGHVYFNFDEDFFMRNGNSVRSGLGLTSSFKIAKATLELAGSYEHSWILVKQTLFNPVTGDVLYGDNLTRDPSSFQFRVDFRQPLYQNWDIHFNVSSYSIRTDATYETSILPVEKKSNMRIFGGLIYRFSL